MSLHKIDFMVGTNEDWPDSLALWTPDANGAPTTTPLAITEAWRVYQHLRSPIEALHTVLSLSIENERLELRIEEDTGGDPVEVLLIWNVPEAVMRTIPAGTYPHDIILVDPDGGVTRFAEGVVTVKLGVTRR